MVLTVCIFVSCYVYAAQCGLRLAHQKIIIAGLLTCAQIILTEMLLGLAGWLSLPWLVLLNGLMSIAVLSWVHFSDRDCQVSIIGEIKSIFVRARSVCSPLNAILCVLAGFVLLWMLIAVYLLPPRSSDDITYHLPAIFEDILHHRIFLLPVSMYGHFALPENAELLLMWPAVLGHSQQFIDSVQVIMAFLGVVVIYGLSRAVGVAAKTAFFVSMLFLFSPLVLAQMGSSYIDLICGVFFLICLYSAVVLYQTKNLFFLYTTGLAGGLLLGMRYDSLALLPAVLPFLYAARGSITKRNWSIASVLVLIASAYWYVRNGCVLKTPIYPLDLSSSGLGIFRNHSQGHTFLKLSALWHDTGLMSLHGGYGLIFWGICLPAWLYVMGRSIVRKEFLNGWLFLPMMVGMVKLLPVPLECFSSIERYSLFMVGLGMVAIGRVLTIFDQEILFQRAVKPACVIFAVLGVVQLSVVDSPNYRVDVPISDLMRGNYYSEEKYIGPGFPKSLVQAWALLDYLTINDSVGISCYFAMTKVNSCCPMDKTWVSPLYGTHLQNRVWNLQQDQSLPPDAFLYYEPFYRLHYFGPRISPQKVLADPNYEIVMKTKNPVVLLLLRKDLMRNPAFEQRVKEGVQ